MGEPSLLSSSSNASLEDLRSLVQRQFPGYTVITSDNQVSIVTVHSVGQTEMVALRNALKDFADMESDGRSLRTILDDVLNDLSNPGMSKERHDSLHDLLNIASQCLDAGVLTKTVPWIMVAGYTREIETLRQRTSTRLGMVAQEIAANQAARNRASTKFPRLPIPEALLTLTPMQRLRWQTRSTK